MKYSNKTAFWHRMNAKGRSNEGWINRLTFVFGNELYELNSPPVMTY